MGEGDHLIICISILFTTFLHISNGCGMENVTLWTLPVRETILDTFYGTVISRNTWDIEEITDIRYGETTISPPYLDISLESSLFTIRTSDAFKKYEEIEVSARISITVDFKCAGGVNNNLVFWIDVNDTNNNAPQFMSDTGTFEFIVAPPLPPGYLVTGCLSDITVRDIDLTTLRIDFTIEENPYFEIEYDEAASTAVKEFKARLRTTTFIRSLSEPIELKITATDVDQTKDPALSTEAKVRIVVDSEFQFPEEPIFGETFYLADYTEDHKLNLSETISLKQGFDEYVNFALEGEHKSYFDLDAKGNEVKILVVKPLSDDILREKQIFLKLKANREFTSGSSATVVVQLPEEIPLQFESVIYEGTIINNGLQLDPLVLKQGYEDVTVSAKVNGDYSPYFTATVKGNEVSLTMTPLVDDIINKNSFISIPVVATSDRSETSTVVNLEIIKDDNVTPVFDELIYHGTYDPVTGLTAPEIKIVQGFDETVTVALQGECADYFKINPSSPIITLTSSTLPPEIYNEQYILLTIVAVKPRTVGANAAIHIALPAENPEGSTRLSFDHVTYLGTLENNQADIPSITLSEGFTEGVVFSLHGDLANHFSVSPQGAVATVELKSDIPEELIPTNRIILLKIQATAPNAMPAYATIVIEYVMHDDVPAAVELIFAQTFYSGSYTTAEGISFLTPISLTQGYDSNVIFALEGDDSQYFGLNPNGNSVTLRLTNPIPAGVLANNQQLVFVVTAKSPASATARATVVISLLDEYPEGSAILAFDHITYLGTLENNQADIPRITLIEGFTEGVVFSLHGDLANHFSVSPQGAVATVELKSDIPEESIPTNHIILLKIQATAPNAMPAYATIVIEYVIHDDVSAAVELIFAQTFYSGSYTTAEGISFLTPISLTQGYDSNVIFALEGDDSQYFGLNPNGNSVTLRLTNLIPAGVLANNQQLVFVVTAKSPASATARATVVISLLDEYPEGSAILAFDHITYLGTLENNQADIPSITLIEGFTEGVVFSLHGDLANHFSVSPQGAVATVELKSDIPEELIPTNRIILLKIQATAPNAMPAYATIVIEYVMRDDVSAAVELIFAQTFYSGSYTTAEGISFLTPISLTQGYDSNVIFALEGDDSQYFGLNPNGNSVTLRLTNPIPAGVLANNQQLVFVVTAKSPASATARAAVVISLLDEYPEGSAILAFDHITYLGTLENNQADIPSITLIEGFTESVVFSLHGDLANHFSVSPQGAVATVELKSDIPEELIPTNRIILLKIQATAPNAMPAYATIVIEYVIHDDVSAAVELIFAQTFYSGSYTTAEGISFLTPISLTQGYDSNVIFALEGDDSQYFGLNPNGNSVTLRLTNPIPAGVLANNQQLVFVVTAKSPASATARATVVISLLDEYPEGSAILAFDHITYLGTLENNQADIPSITLIEGFTEGVVFSLHGDLANHFSVSPQGAVATVELKSDIPEELIPTNRIILLKIQATAPNAMPAYATIVIEYVMRDDVSAAVELIFAQTFYSGSYTTAEGISFLTPISLTQGYDSNVIFALEGDDSQYFGLNPNGNSVTLRLTNPIPAGVLANNQQLVFVVTAKSPASATARAAVVISLLDEYPEGSAILAFDHITYLGTLENNQADIPSITLIEGFTESVVFSLHGDLANHFSVSPQGAVATVELKSDIPEELIPTNRIILLKIQATAPNAMPAYATIVIEYVMRDDVPAAVELIFAQTFYSGSYTTAEGISFLTPISLTQGYDSNVIFAFEGDDSQYFGLNPNGNSVNLRLTNPIPAGVLANNQQLVFVVTAKSPASATARATVVISLLDEYSEGSAILAFDHITYLGTLENNQADIPSITLIEGFTEGVVFSLHGDLANHFSVSPQGAVATVELKSDIPEELIPTNRIILLEIQATAPNAMPAYATIVIEYVMHDDVSAAVELIFAQTFYSGSYTTAEGISFLTPISLTQGYDSNVIFALEGDDSQYFGLNPNGNSVTLRLTNPIPAGVLANNQQLVFVVTAKSPASATARATVVISLLDDSQAESDVAFNKVLFGGIIQNGVVNHERVTITGFTGSNVELHGAYSSLFLSELSNGVVTVTASGTLPLPSDVTLVPLELRAATAAAVLLLDVIHTGIPPALPAVTFSSPSYAVRVEITHTGLVGRVHASANNGEALTYSLHITNTHLQERLSINSEGELYLSAPANSGSYNFEVVATTIFTQTSGAATVHLSVEAVTECGTDIVMPPLIVVDVDEEEPHKDLINGIHNENCHLSLSNRWPLDQIWIYVDETGLHTTKIDREDESIAFMPVSQVQVEVTLHCDGDTTRTKRSLVSDSLGPYDYGTNKWILTDTIPYNSRRSLVNVIVNDINDNYPVFVDKANEPIAVGYPVPELAERVLPRSLAELQATDADIGENAALRFWSTAPELAVAPTTGFVHLRDGAILQNNSQFTVHATDRNGEGLTGSIDILVRLLDESYIAVVTIKDAFLDDEQTVISYLTEAVGYDVKVLRSVVISNSVETYEVDSRKKRDITSVSGASLQLYVYGLIARELVSVEQLASDISNIVMGPVSVTSTLSLQDHLEAQEICVIAGRDVGLLVSTIVLSVLLFIVLVLIAVWFFLRWRKNKNYDELSDENSLTSRNESVDKFTKPEMLPKARLDIAELKKSEKRLQERLDAPIEEISVEPTSSRKDAILDMPTPELNTPIVIQSIDKLKDAADESSEDEFGEIKTPKRKSVVTFNENVEKIIHVEDTPDTEDLGTESDYEVYKL